MEPEMIERGPIQIVGVLTRGKPEELDYSDIWANQYMPFDAQVKPFSPDGGYYGAWFSEEGGSAYLAGMAVEAMPNTPAGLVARTLPAAKYAVFTCTMKTMSATYPYIFQQWLPASAYALDSDAADFEYYPPTSNSEDSPVRIYIPIKQKEPVG